jgi:WD40 repeat protein
VSVTAPYQPPTDRPYFVTGGTLLPDAPCYVERRADAELFDSLRNGEFCYILTARQMGKSSLMVRTARRLREAGVAAVVVDLTARGQNLSPEQWYFGQLTSIAVQLDCEEAVEEYWYDTARRDHGPLQRWQGAFAECILPHCPGRIVVFIDEIDIVRSLGFNTDEFFMAIREFYNRRTHDARFERLTFCLLGVATPSSLIEDARVTPFNIGRRVELTDFTPTEAAALRVGLSHGGREAVSARLLARVLHWTGGHPYLTQALCRAVAADAGAVGERDVDRHCHALFFTPGARDADNNLIFVQDRLLRADEDVAGTLTTYAKIRAGGTVYEAETPHAPALRLSGICGRDDRGRLRVRNRVYQTVFDPAWVRRALPDAEYRRQRDAYRLGVLRASLVATAALGSLGAFGFWGAFHQGRASQAEADARANRFVTAIGLAQRAYENNEVPRAIALLRPYREQPEFSSRFEVGYLWSLCHQEVFALPEDETVRGTRLSPDGRFLRRFHRDGTVREFRVEDGKPVRTYRLPLPTDALLFCSSPDGTFVGYKGVAGWVRVFRSADGTEVGRCELGAKARPLVLTLSGNGKLLAIGDNTGAVQVWQTGGMTRPLHTYPPPADGARSLRVSALRFSPDGKTLAAGYANGKARLLGVGAERAVRPLVGHEGQVSQFSWSPDGKRLASCGWDGLAVVTDVTTGRVGPRLRHRVDKVYSVAFDASGGRLVTGTEDGLVRTWDARTGAALATFRGQSGYVTQVGFTLSAPFVVSTTLGQVSRAWRDGSTARPSLPPLTDVAEIREASFNADGTCRVFEAGRPQKRRIYADVSGSSGVVRRVLGGLRRRFAYDISVASRAKVAVIATGKAGVEVWDLEQGRLLATLSSSPRRSYEAVAVSADGSQFVAGTNGESGEPSVLEVWNVREGKLVETPRLADALNFDNLHISADGSHVFFVLYRFRINPATKANEPEGQLGVMRLRTEKATIWIQRPMPASLLAVDEKTGIAAMTFVTTDGNSNLVLVSTHDGTILREVGPIPTPNSLSFSPDGRILVIGDKDRSLTVFDVSTCRETLWLTDEARSDGACFLGDGKNIAAVGIHGGVVEWRGTPRAER